MIEAEEDNKKKATCTKDVKLKKNYKIETKDGNFH